MCSFSPQSLSGNIDVPLLLPAASSILGLGESRPAAVELTGDFPNNLGVSWKLRPNPVGPGWGVQLVLPLPGYRLALLKTL